MGTLLSFPPKEVQPEQLPPELPVIADMGTLLSFLPSEVQPEQLPPELELALDSAAAAIRSADALIVFCGAGMGVDSGLGTYRGANAGVWQAGHDRGLDYDQLCRSQLLAQDDEEEHEGNDNDVLQQNVQEEKAPCRISARLAWGFWRFQHELYTVRSTPHDGYRLLQKWGESTANGLFVVTSNVDGHWLRMLGEDSGRVHEIHGSIQHMQIMQPSPIFAAIAKDEVVWKVSPERDYASMAIDEVDAARVARVSPLPTHPRTEAIIAEAQHRQSSVMTAAAIERLRKALRARPNVLMFGDPSFDWTRTTRQNDQFDVWKDTLGDPKEAKVCILEIGAGQAVRTIKDLAESELVHWPQCKFIRINYSKEDGIIETHVKDYFESWKPPVAVGDRGISIVGLGALDALTRIDNRLRA